MDQQQIVADYEARASKLGLSIADMCREASLHPTTFSRWKASERNPKPIGMTFTSMAAIERVLTTKESPRQAAA